MSDTGTDVVVSPGGTVSFVLFILHLYALFKSCISACWHAELFLNLAKQLLHRAQHPHVFRQHKALREIQERLLLSHDCVFANRGLCDAADLLYLLVDAA